MKTVPHSLRGPFRNVLRVAMDEALEEKQLRSERLEIVHAPSQTLCCSDHQEAAMSTSPN